MNTPVHELPTPLSPTDHPWYADGRHPRKNVFTAMPVANIREAQAGDAVHINVATYVDPYAELDIHRLIASRPRWMQGLDVVLDQIKPVFDESPRDAPWRRNYPADQVFAGDVVNHGGQLAVVGVLHPERPGWLAFVEDTFGDESVPTVADLKAQIGQISPQAAAAHDATYREQTAFMLDNKIFS